MAEALHNDRFGHIRVTRSTGGSGVHFGSAAINETQIRIEISGAKVERSLSGDNIFPTERLLTFELTPAQWVHMLTAIGDAWGTPCTFDFRVDKGYLGRNPLPTSIAPAKTYEDEVAGKARRAMQGVREAEKILIELGNSKAPKKSDILAARQKVSDALMQVERNIPFVLSRFSEAVDTIANDKMVEVEARIALRLEQIALQAIAADPSLMMLEGPSEP